MTNTRTEHERDLALEDFAAALRAQVDRRANRGVRGEHASHGDGRPGTTDDVANAVLFLASSESSYINGAELFVDGGQTQI